MVSFNTSQLFHDDSNGCWVPLELAFIASAVVTRMRMRCYDHMAHGTSPLYTSVRSLRDLHSLGPSALGCVNSVDTVALEVTRHASSYHAPLQWLSSITPVRLLPPLCVVTPLTVLVPPSFQRLFVVTPVTLFLPPCVVTPVASSVL